METVQSVVKRIVDTGADKTVRTVRRLGIGHAVQQGDVYLHYVSDQHPRGKQVGAGSVQIALGTGNGARHMATGAVKVYEGAKLPECVKMPQDINSSELLGPVVVASESWELTHPEHPNHCLPAGTYQVTYQIDYQTLRRVID